MSKYKKSNVGSYISKRIDALRGRKTQKEIAEQAGYEHANNISMIKNGTSKLPLDRVPALASPLNATWASSSQSHSNSISMTKP